MSAIDRAALLRFELRYQWRRVLVPVTAAALSALAATMVATRYAAAGIPVNAPVAVAQSLGLLSLWALVTQTLFVVHAILRDREHGFLDLVRAQPVTGTRLLLVRTGVVVATGVLVYGLATLVLAITPFLVSDPSRVAPFSLATYVQPFLTLVVPNVALSTALLVAIATAGRSAMATYVGAVGLFALYMLTAFAVASPLFAGGAPATPDALARAAVLDPFGLSAVFEETRYWTTAQRAEQLVHIGGRLLLNRALWLGVALLALLGAVRADAAEGRRAARGGSARRRARARDEATRATGVAAVAWRPVVPRVTSIGAELRASLALELRLLANSWPIRVLLLGLCVVVIIELLQNLSAGEYGTKLLPTSALLARRATDQVAVLGVFLLVWLSGEVMWRDRITRFAAILDATPQRDGTTMTARLLALVAVVALALGCAVLVALGVQSVAGGSAIEWRVYAMHVLVTLWPLMLWTMVFGGLHPIIGSRWGGLGGGVTVLAVYLTGSSLGLEHPMTRFPDAPPLRWSDLDGFGPSWRSYVAFMCYWSALAVWLLALAWGVRPRAAHDTLRQRFRRTRMDVSRTWRRGFAASTGVAVGAVGFMWNTTWAGDQWRSTDAQLAWRAGYERRFRALYQRPHARIVHADLRVQLPSGGARADITGELRLHNVHAHPIDTVWVGFDADAVVDDVRMGEVPAVRPHAAYPTYAIPLATPLASGRSASLRYRLHYDRTRPRAEGYDRMLTSNGSYLTTTDLLPVMGYVGRYEIGDSASRARFGLGAATLQLIGRADTADLLARQRRDGPVRSWMTARLVVVTDSGLRALGTGELRGERVVGAERIAEYVADTPTPPRMAVLAGRYAVQRRRVHGTPVELWYHPTHRENVSRLLDAASVSLRELTARFGTYPHRTLRMVELPAGWGFGAFAMPGTLLLTEDRGMRLDARYEGNDLLLRRIGHEVAHQWWGGAVSPADVVGAGLLVEGLAKYAEQRVVAAVHGEHALPAMLAFDHDRYLAGRSRETAPEPVLAESGYGDDYLIYGKAAIALHALHAALGDSAMTRALRRVLVSEGGPLGAATTATLRAALDAESRSRGDSLLVAEWLEQRRVYDLRVDSVRVVRGDRGGQLAVFGRATTEDRDDGVAGMVVELAVRLPGRGGAGGAAGGARTQVVPVRTEGDGRFVARVALAAAPDGVEVDPHYLWVDRNRSNNAKPVGDRQ